MTVILLMQVTKMPQRQRGKNRVGSSKQRSDSLIGADWQNVRELARKIP